MQRALVLAASGLEPTSPNPVVGCLVLDAAGAVAAEACSAPRGGSHAEVLALQAAGARSRGGTAVVTLEPCNATGRTGPCTEVLLAAGLARVVYAVPDPLPPFAGGAAALRAAGIDVEGDVLVAEAEKSMDRWLAAARTKRPFVTWKYAASLDGRSAAADGTSRWLTGAQARAEVHLMRSRHDAVLVGVQTILHDDPQLTARDCTDADHQPLRVVLDSGGRTPPTARVRDDAAPTLVLTRADVAIRAGRLDPHAVLDLLYDRGVRSVLVEGGPTAAATFLAADLVDRVVGYLAPALLGAGPAAVGDLGGSTIADALRLHLDEVTRIGDDVRITARPSRRR